MAVRLRIVASILLLAAVAACTGTPRPTNPSTSAQPTYLCTGGTQTATPFPCDQTRYDEQQQTKQLEDQAKAVYQRYWKEFGRVLGEGGVADPTPEFLATLDGAMLTNAMVVPKFLKEKGWVAKPLVSNVRVAILSVPLRADAEVSLLACEDLTGTIFLDLAGTKSGGGHLGVQNLALKRFDGALKIYDSAGGGDTCPID